MLTHTNGRLPRCAVIIICALMLLCSSLLPALSADPIGQPSAEAAYAHALHYETVVAIPHHYIVKIHTFMQWAVLFFIYLYILLIRNIVPKYLFDVPFRLLLRSIFLMPLKFTSKYVVR
ncbi:hypothetical protein [Paenibacillus apiarius]|uniref:Uncharacterized protein n=1 Tax=Paenibacillus apiarius TaxID=46240 RepID=A0ABT4DMX3_9BACL|nr:hypothetical protein [Paenibacillus apiarius]MBN3522422.1 hypothetical protein [Paenibacillus apiarius]MCY9514722.1 hypothetical protein [Paenibacillus apiarius]MCY9518712.1 hypothetical protein [Paenibacillus apiarius]MCY9552847.1 hypothetical protein [Paenibacillus apiarius]MCY9556872.1 hypothetical protein [Paenibacillus apiarius]